MKWEYFTAHCYFQEKDKQNKNDHWALNLFDNQHHGLNEGLKILGGSRMGVSSRTTTMERNR
jgi:hypothetical protein